MIAGWTPYVEGMLGHPLRASQQQALPQIEAILASNRSVWLHGPTRSGKSSLARAICKATQLVDPIMRDCFIDFVTMESLIKKIKDRQDTLLLNNFTKGAYVFDDAVRESEVNLKLFGSPANVFAGLFYLRHEQWEQGKGKPCIVTSNHPLSCIREVYEDQALAARMNEYFSPILLSAK